jgi:spore germination cell wall hydrolase CwlJ-like protein
MAYEQYDDLHLLALCVWREARGEVNDAQLGVACSIRNRVDKPGWWGTDYRSVILKPWQYSSFNAGDPNSIKFPDETDSVWLQCLENASLVINGNCPDNTDGAQSYFDKSLDNNPPKWAATMTHTLDIGRLHFYKV